MLCLPAQPGRAMGPSLSWREQQRWLATCPPGNLLEGIPRFLLVLAKGMDCLILRLLWPVLPTHMARIAVAVLLSLLAQVLSKKAVLVLLASAVRPLLPPHCQALRCQSPAGMPLCPRPWVCHRSGPARR